MVEVSSQLAEVKNLLDCGRDSHIFGLDGGEGNCAMYLTDPHDRSSTHHGDEARSRAHDVTIS